MKVLVLLALSCFVSLSGYAQKHAYRGTNGYVTAIPGGTRTLIPVTLQTVYTSNNTNFNSIILSAAVEAGDRVIVDLANASVMQQSQQMGMIQSGLSHVVVGLNGVALGDSVKATYAANTPGVVQIQLSWSNLMLTHSITVRLDGGIAIERCRTNSGAVMACPVSPQ